MSHCRPEYSFRRLDNPKSKIAPGWNFRHADYFSNNNRTLFKSYGILFVVDVQGQAGKFNLIPFFLNVGAGLESKSYKTPDGQSATSMGLPSWPVPPWLEK